MNNNEWLPYMITNNSIQMVQNDLINMKNKIAEKDYLTNFFGDELFILDIKSLEVQTIMQNIRIIMIEKQGKLVDLYRKNQNLEMNKEINIKKLELHKLSIDLLTYDINLHQIHGKINRIKHLIGSRKNTLFEEYSKDIKHYLIDDEQ